MCSAISNLTGRPVLLWRSIARSIAYRVISYGIFHNAGVNDYHGPFDSQDIFDTLWEGALVTGPLKIDITFYCKKCDGMATAKTCPHDPEHHISISGTKQREMLAIGEDIPAEFSRPEVVKILREFYAGLG